MKKYLSILLLVMALDTGCTSPQPLTQKISNYKTLKQAAESNGMYVGTEVEAALLRNDPNYSKVIKREFNLIVPQNEMKFGWVNKNRNTYDFSDADFIVDFAQKNQMKVRGHAMAWHRNFPNWFKEGHFSSEELQKILVHHIQTEIRHFKSKFPGTIIAWDVVNEAILKDGTLRTESPWSKIGLKPDDYITVAFEAARAADPDAKLFYNDFGTEALNKKSDAIYTLLKALKKHQVPIDGIGFQMHLDYREKFDFESIAKNFDRFAKLGLEIQITEFDDELPESASGQQLNDQATIYRKFAALCASAQA